jgi:hypothetical protein
VIYSDSATIHVQDFPSEKPADFNQISGRNLKISASINKPEIRHNESFNLELTISGFGNLKLLQAPKIELPSNMELKKVDYFNELTTDKNGMSGHRTFIYSILPKAEGKFEIPSISMSYLNNDREEYERIASPTIVIDVRESDTTISSPPPKLNHDNPPSPQREKKPTTMIVLDISNIILAQEFAPPRETDLIQELSKYLSKTTNKVGIMLYSSIPILLHEPTNKNTLLVDTLMTIEKIVHREGAATGVAILMANYQLKNSNAQNKNIIVLTDEDSNNNIISERLAAEISRALNIRTFIIGLNGRLVIEPITIQTHFNGETEMLTPNNLNDEALAEVAQISGAKYYSAYDKISFQEALRAIDKEISKNPTKNNFGKNPTYSESEIDMIFNIVHQDIKEKMENSAN